MKWLILVTALFILSGVIVSFIYAMGVDFTPRMVSWLTGFYGIGSLILFVVWASYFAAGIS